MKLSLIAVMMFYTIASAFAGDNALEMGKKGLYIGETNNREECTVEVKEIEKTLVTRKIVGMKVKVSVGNFSKDIALKCENNMEMGHSCLNSANGFSLMLLTKLGYHGNAYPDFYLRVNNASASCYNLQRVR